MRAYIQNGDQVFRSVPRPMVEYQYTLDGDYTMFGKTVLTDVKAELVNQVQEVLDAKAASDAAYRKVELAEEKLKEAKDKYYAQILVVEASQKEIEKAHRSIKVKEFEGNVIMYGNYPVRIDSCKDRDERVLKAMRSVEAEYEYLQRYLSEYRKTYKEVSAAKEAEMAATGITSDLVKKHGYKYRNERGYLTTRKQVGSEYYGCQSAPIVHPLYEYLFDDGKFNMETKEWEIPIPEWALLDFSEK